ncbi:transposable element Tcb2 transposase [Trichonephila clavipes]|nr:transposable element Tcb2 transposase [Trichonephila clavipes]
MDPRDIFYTKTTLRTPSTDQSSRRPSHSKKYMRTANCFIGCHPSTGSTFTRASVSSRTIQRRLAEGRLGSRPPLRVLHLTPTNRCLRLEWCRARGTWTAAKCNHAFFSDGSRFKLSSYDNRVRVWRPRGELLNHDFSLQRHTTPAAGVMVWGAIAYNARSSVVLIRGTITALRHVQDILLPNVMPLMQRLSRAIFQQTNALSHMARVSQDSIRIVTTLPWPALSPDVSPIEHVWDHLGWRNVHPMSLK